MSGRFILIVFLSCLTVAAKNQSRNLDFYLKEGLQNSPLLKDFFLQYKNPVSLILVVIITAGIFLYGEIKVSLFPEITFPKIKVIADNGEQPVDKKMVTGAHMHQPLPIAVTGGFIFALPLLLVIFPTLLHLLYGWEDKSKYL
jgi:multidrug efflux pump subunit AcrB